ncbi:hypothetical protein SALBM311S_03756 [Streptomyces alboniger]
MRALGHRMKAGDQLPPLEILITRTLVVAGAIASRDYQDVHHDADLARQKGSPDIFMNILTTNGLVGRYITDHFGPRAVLRKVAIRLLRTARSLTANPSDAEDLLQTALTKTYVAWERIEDHRALDGYVRRALLNTRTSQWRKRKVDEFAVRRVARAGAGARR